MKYISQHSGFLLWLFQCWLTARRRLWKPRCRVFSPKENHAIHCIRMINLDRHTSRLSELNGELSRVLDRHGHSLQNMSRRFPAVDAESLHADYAISELEPYYALADQLFVEPDPRIPLEIVESNQHIAMTRQEVAVALSHIAVWKEVANGDDEYVLILEDDIYFTPGFCRRLEHAWSDIQQPFDVLYVSFKEGKAGVRSESHSDSVFRPVAGLWQLSGYVLSRHGAQKLLNRLPVRGPIDLWINLQFQYLDVYATHRSIVEQRPDGVSSNSYSILPVLSKIGVLDGGPALFLPHDLPKPVVAFGCHGTGLTSLASALSLLGYRCCSDVDELCHRELSKLLGNDPNRAFDAYVNVGSLSTDILVQIAKLWPDTRFICLSSDSCDRCQCNRAYAQLKAANYEILRFNRSHSRPWKHLCDFLHCNLPVCDFPQLNEQGQRTTTLYSRATEKEIALRFDVSPWVLPKKLWPKNCLREAETSQFVPHLRSDLGAGLDAERWQLLHETFPSNRAYFQPSNFVHTGEWSELCLRKEDVSLRVFTSASIVSRAEFCYGRFAATIRASDVSGVVTGIFLHRNSPRQEIDIEILGKAPSKMLTNVFYNPGPVGTKYDYGYRGTPIQIDLGFDASQGFHEFSIEWTPTRIRWLVDNVLVHERMNWAPTPIPNQPMKFYVNVWPSESREFAGEFDQRKLPSSCCVKDLAIDSYSPSTFVPEVVFGCQPPGSQASV
jgi:GR25 family glycosyltransferase involved in LPS biosynthesis